MASSSQEEMRCNLEQQHQSHQQLITCMDVVGNTVLTGGQEHTLKVLFLSIHFTFLTRKNSFEFAQKSVTGGSGSQDGSLCVWDLITGASMYSIQAHDGAIVSLIWMMRGFIFGNDSKEICSIPLMCLIKKNQRKSDELTTDEHHVIYNTE